MNINVLPLGDPVMHFWLTRSAARAMGINLSEAMAEGKLTAEDYTAMVTNCRQCAFVEECQSWLATSAVQRCEAYKDCRNKAVLERL
ncbi:DUF6455 family protein [Rhodobacteraceae bacterium LMO-12]|nr:DUF6455 family protein [Rhodobacteraceae bacterium LMO-JJ12]